MKSSLFVMLGYVILVVLMLLVGWSMQHGDIKNCIAAGHSEETCFATLNP